MLERNAAIEDSSPGATLVKNRPGGATGVTTDTGQILQTVPAGIDPTLTSPATERLVPELSVVTDRSSPHLWRQRALLLAGLIGPAALMLAAFFLLATLLPTTTGDARLLGGVVAIWGMALYAGALAGMFGASRPAITTPLRLAIVIAALIAALDAFVHAVDAPPTLPVLLLAVGLAQSLTLYIVDRSHPPTVLAVTDPTTGRQAPARTGRRTELFETDCSAPEAVGRIVRAARSAGADVVRIDPTADQATVQDLAWQLRSLGASLELPIPAGSVHRRRARVHTNAHRTAMRLAPPLASPGARAAKRVLDIAGSLTFLGLAAPVLLAAVIAVKLDDRGPAFFRQQRIGRDGTPFMILKLRTMRMNADAALFELLAAQHSGDKPLFKVQDDPRITRIGGFLRRYSIDEIPQLLNVLGGSMSLVGPRPQRQEEVDLYTGNAGHRLGVLPGLTGLWQVSGRSNLSWEDGQLLDITYAHNWSIGMDLSILLRTVRAVLAKDGAE